MKKSGGNLKKLIIMFAWAIILMSPNFCLAVANVPTIKNPFDSLQVPIPGMEKFKEASEVTADGNFKSTWIGEYIAGVYKFGIGVIGVVAMMAVAFGGVMWILSAGNPSKIGEAKTWISSGITGLALGLGSYLLLSLINVDLVSYQPLNMTHLTDPTIEGDALPSADGGVGAPFGSNFQNSLQKLQSLGIKCPRIAENLENQAVNIKQSKIREISASFDNKMLYRLGSKNGSGGEPANATKNRPALPCPAGKVCYDCSGFVRQVLWCAGFKKDPGVSTATMFGGSHISACDNTKKSVMIDGKWHNLEIGDLVGWPTVGQDYGHVLIYDGTGFLDESHGGDSGRYTNSYGHNDLCTKINKLIGEGLHIQHIDTNN